MIRPFVIASALVALAGAAVPAAAFQAGDVYWAPGACDPAPPCSIYRVEPAANSVLPFVLVNHAPGQFAAEPDGSALYLSQFDGDEILHITPTGAISQWVDGVDGATGLLRTSDGTLLAVSYYDGAVYDVTNPASVGLYANGFSAPRNLLERSNGDILLVDQTARTVYRINGGSVTPFAWGFMIGIYDLVEDASGSLFLSTRLGVYDISGAESDPDFSDDAAFAWGRFVVGLTVDPDGRLLASQIGSGAVYDITAGGDFSLAAPAATVPGGLGDTALDTLPFAGAGTPQVPLLGPAGYALLASLLLVSGRRSG